MQWTVGKALLPPLVFYSPEYDTGAEPCTTHVEERPWSQHAGIKLAFGVHSNELRYNRGWFQGDLSSFYYHFTDLLWTGLVVWYLFIIYLVSRTDRTTCGVNAAAATPNYEEMKSDCWCARCCNAVTQAASCLRLWLIWALTAEWDLITSVFFPPLTLILMFSFFLLVNYLIIFTSNLLVLF